MKRIGIIGIGNMGYAILEGLFKKRISRPRDVWVYDKVHEKAAEVLKKWDVNLAASSSDLVKKAPIILLAVKPQDLKESSKEFKPFLGKGHLIITILAGTPVAKIKTWCGKEADIVRAMPNLAAKVGEAVIALTGKRERSLSTAEKIFSGCGTTVRLKESFFDLVTAVSGSGPAYFFLLMELLMKAGVQNGLSRDVARLLAVHTAVGASKLAQHAPESPEALRVKVTSKGGTTEAALRVLEKHQFSKIFLDAVQAAVRRGRELSQA